MAELEDADVLALLEDAERAVDLHRELEGVLRRGFVELSSAKFSKGLVGNLLVSPESFPADAGALRKVEALEPCADAPTRFALRLQKVDPDGAAGADEPPGPRLRKPEAATKNPQQDATTPGSTSSAAATSSSASSSLPKNDPVYRWLRMKPRNQLEKAQTAFVQALALATELAEHKMLLAARVETNKDQQDQSAP